MIKDKYSSVYKELFNELITTNKLIVEDYKPFQQKEGYVNVAVIVYNMLRDIYDKNMQNYGRPLSSANIKLSSAERRVFLNKLRKFAMKYDGEFIELDKQMKEAVELINKKSQSQRTVNGKPISEKPAEILPWSKEVEVKVISSKIFEKECPDMIGRKFIKINGKDSYENIMETFKIRI